MALVLLVLGATAWKIVVKKPGDPAPATNAPAGVAGGAASAAATVGARDWVRRLPHTLTGDRADDLSLSAAEVAPARFSHQLQLARRAMRPGETIGVLKVQPDGTLVVLAMANRTSRWIATKKDLDPMPLPSAAEYASLVPLAPTDIDPRAPAKLRRVILRAGGIAPGKLMLWHATGGQDPAKALYLPDFRDLLGDAPVWQIKWPLLVGGLLASADAHTIKGGG